MKTRTLNAVIDSIVRPNTCFANVSANPTYYLRSSVIIFLLAAVSAFLSSTLNVWYWSHDGNNQFGFSLAPHHVKICL